MGFLMMSTWLLASPVLLITLVGGGELAITLLSNLVRVFRPRLHDGSFIDLWRFTGTLIGPVCSRDGSKFAVHEILLVRVSVGGVIVILIGLHHFLIKAALARMSRLFTVGQDHVVGQHVRLKIGHCARSVSLTFGAGADVLVICIWHEILLFGVASPATNKEPTLKFRINVFASLMGTIKLIRTVGRS